MKKNKIKNPKCDFCGKTSDEVCVMIAGNSAFICDECITLSFEVLIASGKMGLRTDPVAVREPSAG